VRADGTYEATGMVQHRIEQTPLPSVGHLRPLLLEALKLRSTQQAL